MMVMEDMLKDFLLGEHLLLVGNQVSDTCRVVDLLYLKFHHPQKRALLRPGRTPVRVTVMIPLCVE